MKLEIVPVAALQDNYAYLVHDPAVGKTAVIDPSESEPVLRALGERDWTLDFILNTHHHADHVGGNLALKKKFNCQVIGPAGNPTQIPGMDRPVQDGDRIAIGSSEWMAMGIPGHTLGHTAYYCESARAVFTGDTLFLMGCGRLFEGTPAQMWESLSKLLRLPDTTRVFCGHEYTEKNGEFALTIEPKNDALKARIGKVRVLRGHGEFTVPALLSEEKATNPFLRVEEDSVRRGVGLSNGGASEVFAELRRRRDNF